MPSALKRFRRDVYLTGIAVGNRNEDRAEEALQFLVQKGEIFNYYRCPRNGENDLLGWDFIVFPEPDWMIGLQVKSSVIGKEAHINRYGLRTACVIVTNHVSIDILAQEILEALGLSTKFLEGEIESAKSEPEPFNTLVEGLLKILGINEEEVYQENTSIDVLVSV